ncbi:MerR family transcriptional regulator [Mesorhizobium intechi]|nr:MerR family transcriptional regulator [Mesorhizobium intechi]
MDIAEVSRRTGVPASTLRYHENRGRCAVHSRGKAPKVATTAIMRRLMLLANARLGDGPKWTQSLPWPNGSSSDGPSAATGQGR